MISSSSAAKAEKKHHLITKIQTNFQLRHYEFCYYFLIFILTDQLKDINKEYYERMYLCEGQKWDLEHEVRKRDWEVLPKNKTKQNFINQKKKKNIYKTTLICLMR